MRAEHAVELDREQQAPSSGPCTTFSPANHSAPSARAAFVIFTLLLAIAIPRYVHRQRNRLAVSITLTIVKNHRGQTWPIAPRARAPPSQSTCPACPRVLIQSRPLSRFRSSTVCQLIQNGVSQLRQTHAVKF